jgi:hypothetical protein
MVIRLFVQILYLFQEMTISTASGNRQVGWSEVGPDILPAILYLCGYSGI